MTIDDVIGAAYLPTDGQANPSDITQSLARGARMAGVQILRGYARHRIIVEAGRIAGSKPPSARIECEKVVVCAGQWTRALAAPWGSTCPSSRSSTNT
jgi:sarcosine dehydrogenase